MSTIKGTGGIYTENQKDSSLYLVRELENIGECQKYMVDNPHEFDEGEDYLLIPIIRIKHT